MAEETLVRPLPQLLPAPPRAIVGASVRSRSTHSLPTSFSMLQLLFW